MQAVGSWWEGMDKHLHQDVFHHPAATKEFTPKSFAQKYYHGLSSKNACAFLPLKNSAPSPEYLILAKACSLL